MVWVLLCPPIRRQSRFHGGSHAWNQRFKGGKYEDLILPLAALNRIDCVVASTKEAVFRPICSSRIIPMSGLGLSCATSSKARRERCGMIASIAPLPYKGK